MVVCRHPSVNTLDQVRTIDRKQEVPHDGAMCYLDVERPRRDFSGGVCRERRGLSCLEEMCVEKFNEVNALKLIARAHQLVMEAISRSSTRRSSRSGARRTTVIGAGTSRLFLS